MNHLLSLTERRASVRSFAPALPSADDIAYIERCTLLAPSACNRQPWRFLYVTSPELLDKLRTTYPRSWFATAPAVYLCLKDENNEWVRPHDNHPHGDIDLAIAIEHLCLAAAERGLGTCWVCHFDVEAARELFQLEAGWHPVALIPIGHPAADFEDKGRQRKQRDEVFVHL